MFDPKNKNIRRVKNEGPENHKFKEICKIDPTFLSEI